MAPAPRRLLAPLWGVIFLAQVSNAVSEDEKARRIPLAEALVGTWESPFTHMEMVGNVKLQLMFGKNGAMASVFVSEADQYLFAAVSQFSVEGDQLICAAFDRRSKPPRIRLDGNTLELHGGDQKQSTRLTRKSKEESVAKYITSFTEDLKAKDPNVRKRALEGLRYVGPAGREAIPLLTIELRSTDQLSHRQFALESLMGMAPDEIEVIPVLIEELGDKREGLLAGWAAEGLGKLGSKAKDAVPALIELLKSESQHNQFIAATALGDIGAEAKAAIPFLAAWGRGKSGKDRDEAMKIVNEAIKKIDRVATPMPIGGK